VLSGFAFGVATIMVAKTAHGISLGKFLSLRTRIANFAIFVLALCIFHVIFHLCGLYLSRRLSRRRTEIIDVFKATTLNTACLVALGYLFSIKMITDPFLAYFWITSAFVLSVARLTLRRTGEYLNTRGDGKRNILILGTNPRAVEFANTIHSTPDSGFRLLGFVDDDWPGMSEYKRSGFEIATNCAGLAEFLRRNVVDEVANFLPVASFYRYSCEVASLCQQHGITMRYSPNTFGLESNRWRNEEFGGLQSMTTHTRTGELWPRTIKRVFDVVVATAALVALSPLILFAAIAIKLASPGPVLFLQERIGLNKRRFNIYKFRTMVTNAETLIADLEKYNEAQGPVFKIKKDPRITPVGSILRRSSIDELPQLVNVLRGDMSLVGPRPLPVRDYEGFNKDWQRRRFSVKPGITCLWQVNGRSEMSFDKWMLLDLQYMDEWSLWLDLSILARTVPAVLKGSGAS
jgi:exopolysaccharide biosynthesis polyprenyl glycosylphosphotransferase